MNLFTWLSNHFFSDTKEIGNLNQHQVSPNVDINPASGLPMVDGIGGIDIAGNSYGFNDSHNENDTHEFNSLAYDDSSFDNDFSSCDISGSSFD